MAITVEKMVKNASFLYKMKFISGKNGINNVVKWVHIIEDDQVSSFLHGNELVFTGGILNRSEDWLLNFAKKLYEAGASAFVVNIGPHTKEIPKEVIDYCEEVNMPLFTIPWETRMVDMTRDFCHKIIKNDQVETGITTTIKNIIFGSGDNEDDIHQMEHFGYNRSGKYTFLCMDFDEREINDKNIESISLSAERIASEKNDLFIRFMHNNSMIYLLPDYSDEEVESFIKEFLNITLVKNKKRFINIGVSTNQIGLCNQEKNFEKAFSAMQMAKNRNETLVYYDKLDIYRLLYSVSEKSVLRGVYHETIGKLEVYDKENDTDLMNLLKTYLENNGSLQLVSEKLFVHRNTVTNQLKRIEKIIGRNPLELEDKIMLFLGLYIKDML